MASVLKLDSSKVSLSFPSCSCVGVGSREASWLRPANGVQVEPLWMPCLGQLSMFCLITCWRCNLMIGCWVLQCINICEPYGMQIVLLFFIRPWKGKDFCWTSHKEGGVKSLFLWSPPAYTPTQTATWVLIGNFSNRPTRYSVNALLLLFSDV